MSEEKKYILAQQYKLYIIENVILKTGENPLEPKYTMENAGIYPIQTFAD